jgi:hypothetical protein
VKQLQKEQLDDQKMQAKNALQRSRGKYLTKPPIDLGYLIEMVNCLPPDGLELRFMHPNTLKASVEEEVKLEGQGRSNLVIESSLDAAAIAKTKHLRVELRNYVWRGEWKGTSFHVDPIDVDRDIWSAITGKAVDKPVRVSIPFLPGAFRRYAEVWDAFEQLHGIAKAATDARQRWNLIKLGRHASIFPSVQIDREGILRERRSLFSIVIGSNKIEARRIKECPVCERIFWAGRVDAGQCGAAKCKSTLSSRLYRLPQRRELYNKARRKKRHKKKLE